MSYQPLLTESAILELKEEKRNAGFGKQDAFHSADIYSKFFFKWVNPVLSLVKNNPLKTEDLGTIDSEHSSANFSSELGSIWYDERYCDIQNNALTKTIFRHYLGTIICLIFCGFFLLVLDLLCIAMLDFIIIYFDQRLNDLNYLIKISFFLIIGKTISIFLIRQCSIFESNLAIKSVLKLNCFIFDKILKASPSSNQKKSSQGEIINYVQVDSVKLGGMLHSCPKILIYPIQILVYVVLLFYFLGFSFIFGIIPLVLSITCNYYLLSNYCDLEDNLLRRKDERMKITTETFEALKILKMYAWEDVFRKRIISLRDEELIYQRKLYYKRMIQNFIFCTAPVLATIATIGAYQYLYSFMNIDKILIGLYVFSLLKKPLRDLPYYIVIFIDTIVSMKRIEESFL